MMCDGWVLIVYWVAFLSTRDQALAPRQYVAAMHLLAAGDDLRKSLVQNGPTLPFVYSARCWMLCSLLLEWWCGGCPPLMYKTRPWPSLTYSRILRIFPDLLPPFRVPAVGAWVGRGVFLGMWEGWNMLVVECVQSRCVNYILTYIVGLA